jgi:predicted MFS family arabinose efflux permease
VSALYGVGQVLGTVAGQVVGAQYIADTAQGFRVTGVVLVVAALVVVLLAPEPPRDAPVGPGRPASPGATAASWRAAVAFPRGAPDFVWALWGRLLLMVGYFVVASYQLYILTDLLRLDVAEAGRTITAIGLAAAVGALLGAAVSGPLSDALGRRKSLVMVSSLLIGAAMVPPLLAPAPGVVVAAAGLAGLGFGIYLAVDTALMTEVLPSSADHAKDMGILNVANSAGQIVAPGVASLVVGVAGYRPLYAVALVLCVASVFCIRPIQGVR